MHTLETLLQLADAYQGMDREPFRKRARAKLDIALQEVLVERDQLQAECEEQARLNGMGASRELKLMAELDQLQADLVKHRELLVKHLAVIDPLRAERDALQGEVAAMKRLLGNVHNNGANWSGQRLIRDYLASSVAMKEQTP